MKATAVFLLGIQVGVLFATPPPAPFIRTTAEEVAKLEVKIVVKDENPLMPSLSFAVTSPRETHRLRLLRLTLIVAPEGEDRSPHDLSQKHAREVTTDDLRLESTLFGSERERAVIIVSFTELDAIAYHHYVVPVSLANTKPSAT